MVAELGEEEGVAHPCALTEHRSGAVEDVNANLAALENPCPRARLFAYEAAGEEAAGGKVEQDRPRIANDRVGDVLDVARRDESEVRRRVAHFAKDRLLFDHADRGQRPPHFEAAVHGDRGARDLELGSEAEVGFRDPGGFALFGRVGEPRARRGVGAAARDGVVDLRDDVPAEEIARRTEERQIALLARSRGRRPSRGGRSPGA